MKISSHKRSTGQRSLFDRDEFLPLQDQHGAFIHGRARTTIGEFFEELTAVKVNGVRHKTDARCDYCPDVSCDGDFYEVKAAGLSKQTFIYKGRLDKDLVFSQSHNLSYFIWSHCVPASDFQTVADLKRQLPLSIKSFFVIPFNQLYQIVRDLPVMKLNSAYGHSDTNETYGEGYRISLSLLKDYEHAAAS